MKSNEARRVDLSEYWVQGSQFFSSNNTIFLFAKLFKQKSVLNSKFNYQLSFIESTFVNIQHLSSVTDFLVNIDDTQFLVDGYL